MEYITSRPSHAMCCESFASQWKLIRQINNKIIYNIIASGESKKHFHLRHDLLWLLARGRSTGWQGLAGGEGGSQLLPLLFMHCGCSTCSLLSLYHSFLFLHSQLQLQLPGRGARHKYIYVLYTKNLYGMQVAAISQDQNIKIQIKTYKPTTAAFKSISSCIFYIGLTCQLKAALVAKWTHPKARNKPLA